MKISLPRAPQLPQAVTPAGPTTAPIPTPNVHGLGASSFTPGVERRFSVRFLNGLEPKLKLAGLPQDFVTQFHHRFAGASRTELDREGRVIEGLLASAHPAQGIKLYDTLARLQSHVTPGGFHIAANQQHSWTVTPPREDPFVFSGKPGDALALADGTKLSAQTKGLLELSHPTGPHTLRDTVSRTLSPKWMHSVVNAATLMWSALSTKAPSADGVLSRALAQTSQLGTRFADPLLQSLRTDAATPGPAQPAFIGVLLLVNSMMTLAQQTPAVANELQSLLENAGRSAAPSRRADPELEKVVLLLELGLEQAPAKLSELAAKLQGAARDVVLAAL